ncbi:lupeol synthase-like [Silene latifolia]|uniref:lupeol synthase-like n=1 Tax=Silene latifolia TaxID=37657 RepID=UPI003D7867F8
MTPCLEVMTGYLTMVVSLLPLLVANFGSQYFECTSSAIQSIELFKKLLPKHMRNEVELCISQELSYIEEAQNPDGSCYRFYLWNMLWLNGNMLLILEVRSSVVSDRFAFVELVYTNLQGNRSNLVQMSWAILSLIKVVQEISGAFTKNCTLSYGNNRNIFMT